MTDGAIRELCNRFFDAYQDRRVDDLAEIYAPDCVVWHNVFGGREMSGADNLAALPASYRMQRRRTYNDRTINTFAGGNTSAGGNPFDGGFVIQYTLHGVQHSGHTGALWVCIVGLCKDGKITRIDEYMDSGKFPAWRGAKSSYASAAGAGTGNAGTGGEDGARVREENAS